MRIKDEPWREPVTIPHKLLPILLFIDFLINKNNIDVLLVLIDIQLYFNIL